MNPANSLVSLRYGISKIAGILSGSLVNHILYFTPVAGLEGSFCFSISIFCQSKVQAIKSSIPLWIFHFIGFSCSGTADYWDLRTMILIIIKQGSMGNYCSCIQCYKVFKQAKLLFTHVHKNILTL